MENITKMLEVVREDFENDMNNTFIGFFVAENDVKKCNIERGEIYVLYLAENNLTFCSLEETYNLIKKTEDFIKKFSKKEGGGRMIKTANKTIEEVFKELCNRLKEEGCYPDEYFNICYPESDYSNKFPPYHCIACFPTSDNNKHFIRVEVILNEKRRLVYLGKTLQGFEFACKIANNCAKHLGA